MIDETNEATATAAVAETEVNGVTGGGEISDTSESTGTTPVEGGDGITSPETGRADMYETGDVKVPAPSATAHRATLVSITRFDAPNTGSVGLRQSFRSDSNGMTYERTTWLPKPWAENVHITREELTALGTAAGKKQSFLQRFAETIHNSLNDAELDQLVNAATAAGREAFTKNDYTDLDGYIAKLSELAVNIPVILTTKVEESEGYRPKLIVSRVFAYNHDTSKFKQQFADEQ